jgi:hypothetical protein
MVALRDTFNSRPCSVADVSSPAARTVPSRVLSPLGTLSALLRVPRREIRTDRMPLLGTERPQLIASRTIRVDRVEHIQKGD